MTTTVKVLFESKVAEAVETSQYVSKDCKTAIDKFTAKNISASPASFTVYLVPAGGAPGVSNGVTKVLQPDQTWPFPEIVGHNMEAGSAIYTRAYATNSVIVRASGRQFT